MRLACSVTPRVFAALIAFAPTFLAARAATSETSHATPGTAFDVPDQPPKTCPVTRPSVPPFVPPAPYPAKPGDEQVFWYGTDRLWTMLPRDGMWLGLHHYSPTTPGYRQKIFWWSKGYSGLLDPTPNLTVTGKRLDGPAPAFSIANATNGGNQAWNSFMLVGADIPTYGCWEITGRLKSSKLKFVIWVGP